MIPIDIQVSRSKVKVKPTLLMLGKRGICVLQTAIFCVNRLGQALIQRRTFLKYYDIGGQLAKTAASFQGFYRTSVDRLDYLLIVYSYFMTTRETVKLLPRVSREDLRKLWATVSQIFSSTNRNHFYQKAKKKKKKMGGGGVSARIQ